MVSKLLLFWLDFLYLRLCFRHAYDDVRLIIFFVLNSIFLCYGDRAFVWGYGWERLCLLWGLLSFGSAWLFCEEIQILDAVLSEFFECFLIEFKLEIGEIFASVHLVQLSKVFRPINVLVVPDELFKRASLYLAGPLLDLSNYLKVAISHKRILHKLVQQPSDEFNHLGLVLAHLATKALLKLYLKW